MIRIDRERIGRVLHDRGGLAAWLVSLLQLDGQKREQRKSRLVLVDRISLAPRQSLALVEAEGRRFLVGTSPDGGQVFYALDVLPESASSPAFIARSAKTRAVRTGAGLFASVLTRVSW